MTNNRIPSDTLVHLVPGHRLHWESAEYAYVLLYPDGMVMLDQCAVEVLHRCDGSMTVEDIIGDITRHYPGVDIRLRILEFITAAENKGWISID